MTFDDFRVSPPVGMSGPELSSTASSVSAISRGRGIVAIGMNDQPETGGPTPKRTTSSEESVYSGLASGPFQSHQ